MKEHCVIAVESKEQASEIVKSIGHAYGWADFQPYKTQQGNAESLGQMGQYLVFIRGTKLQACEVSGFAKGILFAKSILYNMTPSLAEPFGNFAGESVCDRCGKPGHTRPACTFDKEAQ
jgi:hypothetical protein